MQMLFFAARSENWVGKSFEEWYETQWHCFIVALVIDKFCLQVGKYAVIGGYTPFPNPV